MRFRTFLSKTFFLVPLLLICGGATVCWSNVNSNQEPLVAQVEIEVIQLSNGKIRISGHTNLPQNTELMFSLDNKMERGFSGSAKGKVGPGGGFQSEEIGPSGGLQKGEYIAEVLMPVARLQPESVKKVIGQNGEILEGPLVERDFMGTSISKSIEVSIGGPKAAEAQRDLENNVLVSIKALKLELCVLLEELLAFKDEESFDYYGFGGGGPHNSWQKKVEALRNKQAKGVGPIPLELRAAPGDLYLLGLQYLDSGKDVELREQKKTELQAIIGYNEYLLSK